MAHNFTAIDDLVKKHNELKYRTGSVAKEFDMPLSSLESHEIGEDAEQETVSPEVDQYITPKSDSIQLPPDLKKLGLETEESKQFNEVLNRIKLPISDDKIMEDLKAPPSESKRWYATILMYILERAHLTLKKVGTKVVRIFKTN